MEIFLRGLKICYTRLDRLSMLPRIPDDDLEGLVKVFLLPSCKSGAVAVSLGSHLIEKVIEAYLWVRMQLIVSLPWTQRSTPSCRKSGGSGVT